MYHHFGGGTGRACNVFQGYIKGNFTHSHGLYNSLFDLKRNGNKKADVFLQRYNDIRKETNLPYVEADKEIYKIHKQIAALRKKIFKLEEEKSKFLDDMDPIKKGEFLKLLEDVAQYYCRGEGNAVMYDPYGYLEEEEEQEELEDLEGYFGRKPKRRKLYFGARGGRYYKRKGKKVYI